MKCQEATRLQREIWMLRKTLNEAPHLLSFSGPQNSQGVKINMMQDRKKSDILGSSLLYLFLTADKMSVGGRWKIPTQARLCRKMVNGIHCVHTSPAYQESHCFLNVSQKAWFKLFQIVCSLEHFQQERKHAVILLHSFSLGQEQWPCVL